MRGVLPNRRPVNMVFQHLALFPMMSVGDNVGYGLARRGVAQPLIRERVATMLKRVGQAARRELEAFFGVRVFLDLRVRVRRDWRQDDRALRELGFQRTS